MPVSPLNPTSLPQPAGAEASDARALRKAGEQFEALMLERLLASARPASSGPQSDWRSMADRVVAETLARQSPLGFATLLERSGK